MSIREQHVQSPDVGSSMWSSFPKKDGETRMQRAKEKTVAL